MPQRPSHAIAAHARPALQQRVAGAILEAAAAALATQGEQASMNDLAAAAGVARATLYRYFPNRGILVAEVADRGLQVAEARLLAARLDDVGIEEGVARSVRALVDAGDPFIVLARERTARTDDGFDRRLVSPLRRLLSRGQTEGRLRDDVSSSWLAEALLGLVVTVSARRSMGTEDTVAAITSFFLDGARNRVVAELYAPPQVRAEKEG